MRRTAYYKRASQRFLLGSRCKTPFEAVAAGIRTLEEWAALLEQEREAEQAYLHARTRHARQRRTTRTLHPLNP